MTINITHAMPTVSFQTYFLYDDLSAGNIDHYNAVVKGCSRIELCDFP